LLKEMAEKYLEQCEETLLDMKQKLLTEAEKLYNNKVKNILSEKDKYLNPHDIKIINDMSFEDCLKAEVAGRRMSFAGAALAQAYANMNKLKIEEPNMETLKDKSQFLRGVPKGLIDLILEDYLPVDPIKRDKNSEETCKNLMAQLNDPNIKIEAEAEDKKKKPDEKINREFRQPFKFNDVKGAYSSDDLFKSHPTFDNGTFLDAPMSLPQINIIGGKKPIIRVKDAHGWDANARIAIEHAAFYGSGSEANSVAGNGISASFNGATPKIYRGETSAYVQLATGLNYMNMGDKGSVLRASVNTLGLYVDDMQLLPKQLPWLKWLKFSPSLQAYWNFNVSGVGSENYKAMFGAEDLKDSTAWYRFNCRFDLLDLPNYFPSTLNLYGKIGDTAGCKSMSILGVTFDNKTGMNANVEFWNRGTTSPYLNFAINQQVLAIKNGTVNFNLALEDALNPRRRGYNVGVELNLTKVSFLGMNFRVKARAYCHFSQEDTKVETAPGTWDSNNIEINEWSVDPDLGPDQLSHSFEYDTNPVAVTSGNKIKFIIGTNNENGLPGIIGELPDGTIMDGNVDVRISSVKVTDITDKKNPTELPGAGNEIVGMSLTDLVSGGLEVELPVINKTGYVAYKIDMKLATNGADIENNFPSPCTTSCIIKVRLERK